MTAGTKLAALGHFLFSQLYADLLLLALAQDSQCDGGPFRKTAHEFGELIRLGQDLVVQHFDDVIRLNAGRGRGTVRNNVIDDQSKTLRQTELFADNSWHFRGFDTEKGDRHFFLMPLAIAGRLSWLARRDGRVRRIG